MWMYYCLAEMVRFKLPLIQQFTLIPCLLYDKTSQPQVIVLTISYGYQIHDLQMVTQPKWNHNQSDMVWGRVVFSVCVCQHEYQLNCWNLSGHNIYIFSSIWNIPYDMYFNRNLTTVHSRRKILSVIVSLRSVIYRDIREISWNPYLQR